MRLVVSTAAFLVLLAPAAAAQSGAGSGSVAGAVRDPGGALIPKASVAVRNVGTSLVRPAQTDDSGRYIVPSLPPGEYEITFEAPGFTRLVRRGVTLLVGQAATVDAMLQLSPTQETVTVVGEAATVETDKTEVSSYVTEDEVHNLPINGRRWDSFVLLTPATVPDGAFGLVSYRGISGLYNNNMIDGADNNQAFFSEARGRTRVAYTISQATIKEFQVGTSNYSAEFGRAAGGLVNAVTRSGANNIRGEGFYFIRDQVFNALNPTIKARGFPQPDDRRQQFGGWVSGPLVRDRLFWLLSYDQQKRNFPAAVDFFNPRGFVTPPRDPAPGYQGALAFFNGLRGLQPRRGDQNIGLSKLDWQVTPRNLMAATVNIMRWRSPNGVFTQPSHTTHESANGFDGTDDEYVIWKLASTLSPTVLNEARFQYTRDFQYQRANAPGPSVRVTDGIEFGAREFLPRAAFPNEKRWQFLDNLSLVRGGHQLKIGADINYVRDLMINLSLGQGQYNYAGLNQFALDCPSPGSIAPVSGCVATPTSGSQGTTGKHYNSYRQVFDTAGQQGRTEFATTDYAFYVQDNARLRPNLTLNLGLRYELQSVPQPPTPNPALPLTARVNVDRNNAGPRFGLAWDPFGKNRMVVRLGYGVYYGRTQNSTLFSHFTNNGARFQEYFFQTSTPGSPVFPRVLSAPPAGEAATPSLNVLARDFASPLIQQFEFTLEREVGRNIGLHAAYLGSRGTRLPFFRDVNLFPPADSATYAVDCSPAPESPACRNAPPAVTVPLFRGPSANRPLPQYGRMILGESVANQWYHGLVLQARKRTGRGLLFSASLTMAKSTDDGQTSETFFAGNLPLNPYSIRNEHALGNFDVRKRFVAAVYWTPSFRWISNDGLRAALQGFKFSTTVMAQSGRPLDAAVSGSPSNSRVSTGALGAGGDSRAPWLGRNVFTADGYANVDVRVAREFRLKERVRLETICEAFNLFNSTIVTQQVTTAFRFSGLVILAQPGFLDPSATGNTLYRERQMQFAFRLRF